MNNPDGIEEAHDASDVGARSCQLVFPFVSMARAALQDAGGEGRGHVELLLDGQLQVPDGPERQEQDQKIREDVDGARYDGIEVRVDAGAWDGRVPRFAHGTALEDDG